MVDNYSASDLREQANRRKTQMHKEEGNNEIKEPQPTVHLLVRLSIWLQASARGLLKSHAVPGSDSSSRTSRLTSQPDFPAGVRGASMNPEAEGLSQQFGLFRVRLDTQMSRILKLCMSTLTSLLGGGTASRPGLGEGKKSPNKEHIN